MDTLEEFFANYATPEERSRQMARELRAQHGKLLEVVCDVNPKRITLVYKDGTRFTNNCEEGFFMQFGYSGTGPSCFHAFLEESGISVSYDTITAIRRRVTLGPQGGQIQCPHCKRALAWRKEYAGLTARCCFCNNVFMYPPSTL